jgi:5-oxoprolinase (ATP-hydrolysing)
VAGIRHLLGLPPGEPVTAAQVECVKMGTTVATNALLERKGEPTLLVTTAGFRDALRIAYQNRPRLFDRHIVLPELLYSAVVEAQERIGAHGDVVLPLDEAALRDAAAAHFDAGLRSVAIVFMHGYRHTAHEQAAAALARSRSASRRSAPRTAGQPADEVRQPRRHHGGRRLPVADPAPLRGPGRRRRCPACACISCSPPGGLTDAGRFQGKDAILSGPAGGIVGMARTASGWPATIIGFDMGGTSTDVSHYAGEFEREFETQVAGVRMRAPMMSIHTVAAGGGSILHFDGARFRVGPRERRRGPRGPASYRRGGPLAVTDANVMVGKIQPAAFPEGVRPGGDEPLDAEVVREVRRAGRAMRPPPRRPRRWPRASSTSPCNMANAIKKISVARGYDVTRYTLQCFGGAGGQHACLVADALGMDRVFIHPLAGVLSAYGMGLADQSVMREQAVECAAGHRAARVRRERSALADRDPRELARAQGGAVRGPACGRVHLRYEGTTALVVVAFRRTPPTQAMAMQAGFERPTASASPS